MTILSKSVKSVSVLVATITLLACAALAVSVPSDANQADEYRFYLYNTVDGEDSTINGWYTGNGPTVISAFCDALDKAKINHPGITPEEKGILFKADKTISDWSVKWESDGFCYGPNYAIWNHSSDKGWFLGNTFGTDKEHTYIISHEKYLDADGAAAPYYGISNTGVYPAPGDFDLVYDGHTGNYKDASAAMIAWYRGDPLHKSPSEYGISLDPASSEKDINIASIEWMSKIDVTKYRAIPGWDISEVQHGYAQLAPLDRAAVPEKVKFGPVEYRFGLQNSVDGQDSKINGWYKGYGTGPVNALYNALYLAKVPNDIKPDTDQYQFRSGSVSDWSANPAPTEKDVTGTDYFVWSYSPEKGWVPSKNFGKDPETTYCIFHGNTYAVNGETAKSMGVVAVGDGYHIPRGLCLDGNNIHLAPRDTHAAPDKVVFGPAEMKKYVFILKNSVDGQDSKINGTYTATEENPVRALCLALKVAGIPNTVDPGKSSVWFGNKSIADWTYSWDASATDVLGTGYATWNHSPEKGWFLGNTFGTDRETTYLISHENYHTPTGKTAKSLGIVAIGKGYHVPRGLHISEGKIVQLAPRDAAAIPEKVVFGPAAMKKYVFILKNSVNGQNSKINGTYTAVEENTVKAFCLALEAAGIPNTIDPNKNYIWIDNKSIADWTLKQEDTAEDWSGPNITVWKYSPEKGWSMGGIFGTGPETTYLISHELFYTVDGKTAKNMGVVEGKDAEGFRKYSAPAGLVVMRNNWIQLAPKDLRATPDKLVFGPYYTLTFVPDNGSDAVRISQLAGTDVVPPKVPVKNGYVFASWNTAVPTVMPCRDMTFSAVWIYLAKPVGGEIVVDKEHPDFKVPENTNGMKLTVVTEHGKIVIGNSDRLAGKTVHAEIKTAPGSKSVGGDAYRTVFVTDGKPYDGKRLVTLPYSPADGKVPAVYSVSGDSSVKTKVVSSTENSVTFEADGDSVFVVSSAEKSETDDSMIVLPVLFAVAIAVSCAVIWLVKRRV